MHIAKNLAKCRTPASLYTHSRMCFSSTNYDCVVIGAGPGGYVAAIKAAQRGMKTACIEGRGSLGGTCLNVGCIPAKAMLNASHKFHEAQHNFKKLGIEAPNTSINFKRFLENKDEIVKGLTGGVAGLFKKNKVDYYDGWGSFASTTSVNVALSKGGNTTLNAKNILIATGSEPRPLPASSGLALDEKFVISSTGSLSLEKIPEKMIVIGGGVIGLEMGSVYQRIGTQVTVVQHGEIICPFLDTDVSKTFMQSLKKQGIQFELNAKVIDGENNGANGCKVNIHNTKTDQMKTLESDVVLVSIGRIPYTKGLNLEAAGLSANDRGQVEINSTWQTKVPNIYACGDVAPGQMLAHKAEEEGIAAIEHMLGEGGHVNYDTIPGVIYTHPEVANVGKSEQELKAAGIKYNVGKFPFLANSRARANCDTDGLVKILSDAETDKLLGMWIVGPAAGELLSEGVLAMEYGASAEDISRTCHSHPTLSEAVKEAAMAAHDKPIHI